MGCTAVQLKTCRRCGVETPLDQFYRRADSSDGVATTCKACNAAYNRSRYTAKKPTLPATKVCSTCGLEKPSGEFHTNKLCSDGLVNKCKLCVAAYARKRYRENAEAVKTKVREYARRNAAEVADRGRRYRQKNRARLLARAKAYRETHAEQFKEYKRAWQKKHSERLRIKAKRYYVDNKAAVLTRLQEWKKNRRSRDIGYRLYCIASLGVYRTLRNKSGKTSKLLPFTKRDLVERLTATMPVGYTWDDFLAGRLQVDHIVPRTWFVCQTADDVGFKACWSLENLRLLPAAENRRRSNRPDADARATLQVLQAKYPTLEVSLPPVDAAG